LLSDVRHACRVAKRKRARFVQQYGVTAYDAACCHDLELAAYLKGGTCLKKPKAIANWILNDLQSALSAAAKRSRNADTPEH